jgi:hypothetical protein
MSEFIGTTASVLNAAHTLYNPSDADNNPALEEAAI